ncbi:MAG: Gfo/Idh/MocA family oxidoreductase [Tepidisphaeraceae bacterium]|jgi:predicted dehydrogenase
MSGKSVSTESFATTEARPRRGGKLRVAVIGCGGISETQIRSLQSLPDVEIIAAAEPDASRLKTVADKFNISDRFSDWKSLLKSAGPDAVTICTPNALHVQPTVDCLNAGCHVMVEKPMAMTPAECKKMIAAAKRAGKKLAVGFQYRFHPSTEFLLRARDDGRFGKILFVKCQALRRRGIPNWGVFGQKHLQGGGPMIDIGVHVIEMAHYVMGSPTPIAAAANTWTYLGNKKSTVASMWPNWDYKTYTVEDLAIGQVRFDTGAIMQIEASFAAHIKEDVWNFTLVGEKGGCQWDPPQIFTDRAGAMINETPAYVGPRSDFAYLFDLKLRNWVDACLYNKPLRAPGEAGLAVQKILDGVYRSAAAGKEVPIK